MTPNLYGLTLAVAVLVSFLAARKLAPRFGLSKRDVDDLFPWVVVGGIIGARLYYVFFSWEYFRDHLISIFKIWQGGLSIYGAIIGGAVGALIYTLRQKLDFLKFLDLLAVVAPLGQSLGRWGNYFNKEAFGYPTDLPWGVYIPPSHRPLEYLEKQFFHPTFLYESLWDLGVLLILLYLVRQSPRTGYLAGTYLVLYAIGRFFIEALRLDSFFLHFLRVDQMVSLLAVVSGTVLIFWNHEKSLAQDK